MTPTWTLKRAGAHYDTPINHTVCFPFVLSKSPEWRCCGVGSGLVFFPGK